MGHDPATMVPGAVRREDSGHGSPGHVHDDPADRGKRWYQTGKGKLVIFTAVLLGAAWGVELVSPQIGRWAFVAACLIGVAPVARRAFSALRVGQPFTIESLMTIAATGALFIDAAEEAALVVFLFAVGGVLEGVAAGKARDGIRALADLIPKTALLEVNGSITEIPAAGLAVGQTILVRPGDRIAADGQCQTRRVRPSRSIVGLRLQRHQFGQRVLRQINPDHRRKHRFTGRHHLGRSSGLGRTVHDKRNRSRVYTGTTGR